MKKSLFLLCLLVSSVSVFGQTTTFDNLNANNYVNKAISWNSSNYGSGFGHRIINSDPGGQTLLNFQGRHNSTSWADIMTLTSSGKVGIGTINPNTQLTVGNNFGASISGTSGGNAIFGTNLALQQGGTNHNKLYTPYSHSNNYGYAGVQTSWSRIHFYTEKANTTANTVVTPTPRMSINEVGNVGIGTSNPTQKFEVYNTNAFNTSMENQSQDHISLISNDPGNGGFFGGITWKSSGRRRAAIAATREHTDSDHVGLAFFTRGTDGPGPIYESMRITRYGNVGIGTTTPDAKLTVKGDIHAEEVKIDLSVPAPDYVFNKDYDLLTIEEVQEHIAEQGHLPNIPSATEMETNGVALGLMNMKLLEKIEELTLYTIAQEEQLDSQQHQIDKLERDNKKLRSSDSELQTLKTKNQELETRLAKIETLLNKKQ